MRKIENNMEKTEKPIGILIVDDDPATLRLHNMAIKEALKGTDHLVMFTECKNVEGARKELYSKSNFKLLLLDGNLPDGGFADIVNDTPLGGAYVCVISSSEMTVNNANSHDSVHGAHVKPFGYDETVALFKEIVKEHF